MIERLCVQGIKMTLLLEIVNEGPKTWALQLIYFYSKLDKLNIRYKSITVSV